ncbi:MltR family transcriptional regulator [Asaia sp. BMEF1]|uniref:MltR family transcriptional regulator n=1 Tax=Asaia sp. BMEF1 TaxID=3155932 RepID=UPI003F672EDB
MADEEGILPHEDDVFGSLNRLNSLLEKLDERALVLSLAAFAEEELRDLIKVYLMPGEAANKMLEGFSAPLGTLSARIRMAQALGLLTPHQANDLDRLRKIRNEFAHSWEPVSFTDQRIATLIRALNFHSLDDHYPETPLDKVRTSIGLLLLELRVTAQRVRKRGGATLRGQHIIAGVPGDLDEQMTTCRRRLTEIQEELGSASGDRRRFLLAARHRWEGMLEIVRLNAPRARQDEVRVIQSELNAWTRDPDY